MANVDPTYQNSWITILHAVNVQDFKGAYEIINDTPLFLNLYKFLIAGQNYNSNNTTAQLNLALRNAFNNNQDSFILGDNNQRIIELDKAAHTNTGINNYNLVTSVHLDSQNVSRPAQNISEIIMVKLINENNYNNMAELAVDMNQTLNDYINSNDGTTCSVVFTDGTQINTTMSPAVRMAYQGYNGRIVDSIIKGNDVNFELQLAPTFGIGLIIPCLASNNNSYLYNKKEKRAATDSEIAIYNSRIKYPYIENDDFNDRMESLYEWKNEIYQTRCFYYKVHGNQPYYFWTVRQGRGLKLIYIN